ncbi:hypothetical protein KEJ37_01265 [Candidatus Bathyarchaeota archaeon]|nr:hypothetical protein [Candidatus Bathyarchaeota archaeon]
MESKRKASSFGYGAGALAVLVASLGFAAVIYSINIISFEYLNLPAWIFGPLGVYTLLYSFFSPKDPIYYLVWGVIMTCIGVVSATYAVVPPLLILGILLIIIAIIGIAAYKRSK